MQSVTEKMRKDLQEAYTLASENHPLEYYKDMLRQYEEEREAQEAEEAAKAAATLAKKAKKSKAASLLDEDDSMLDITDSEGKGKPSKKRKAEDDGMVRA